jgi:hypothetical protein
MVEPSCTVTGATVIDIKAGAVTIRVADPLTDPEAAVIVAVPCAFEVARPDALIVATPVLPEVQLTVFVRSLLLPSE